MKLPKTYCESVGKVVCRPCPLRALLEMTWKSAVKTGATPFELGEDIKVLLNATAGYQALGLTGVRHPELAYQPTSPEDLARNFAEATLKPDYVDGRATPMTEQQELSAQEATGAMAACIHMYVDDGCMR